ncbi:MAG: YdhR family protein [Anaerolineales bacterium]|uniref:YdhR family protein n=1 Tax=Candidatus Desulfolinea nitratireducens TaxID=2841698 RepID=A0A8J6NI65_9CHLR|nr:YdhR family protein [Candidatus Desulfolinea nitratireducens]MBL6960504.1 YdhR family protein [Anaerolineales bacterium]
MITALVQIKLSTLVSLEKATGLFADAAPNYRATPGLVRKYFLLSEDGSTVGGVYLWESRKEAEQLYSANWRQAITDKYGTEPSVTYFASPVIVDNLAESIIIDD